MPSPDHFLGNPANFRFGRREVNGMEFCAWAVDVYKWLTLERHYAVRKYHDFGLAAPALIHRVI